MPRASGRWGDDEYLAAGPRWEYHCVAAAEKASTHLRSEVSRSAKMHVKQQWPMLDAVRRGFSAVLRLRARFLRRDLRRVRELFDVMHQAKQQPLARKNATWRLTVVSGVRRHCVRTAHGAQSRFAPRTCSPTYPLVTLRGPFRYKDFPAGHTHVRASASYVKSLGLNSGSDLQGRECGESRFAMVACVGSEHGLAQAPPSPGGGPASPARPSLTSPPAA